MPSYPGRLTILPNRIQISLGFCRRFHCKVSPQQTRRQKFEHFLELQGDVKTKQNVLIYPEMQGTLQKVYVREGQRVSKGQLLATIDDGGMASQLNQLKTQAELAKTTFDRQKRLCRDACL